MAPPPWTLARRPPSLHGVGGSSAGALRWGRCAATTAVIVAISTLAHVAAGGAPPPVGTCAGLVAALTPLCWLVVNRRMAGFRLAAVLLAGQAGLHEALMTSAGPAGSMHGAGPLGAMATDHATTAPMLALHLIATVLSVVVLTGAERALSLLLAWLAPRALPVAARPAPVPGPPRTPAVPALLPQHAARMVRHVPRRGPPALPAPA